MVRGPLAQMPPPSLHSKRRQRLQYTRQCVPAENDTWPGGLSFSLYVHRPGFISAHSSVERDRIHRQQITIKKKYMKHNWTRITKRIILGTAPVLLTLLARAATITCGILPTGSPSSGSDTSPCPGNCTVSTYSTGQECGTPAASTAYCSMTDWDGSYCYDPGVVTVYPGSCIGSAGNWACVIVPGGTPTVGPGNCPVPCLSGYDAELCPEK